MYLEDACTAYPVLRILENFYKIQKEFTHRRYNLFTKNICVGLQWAVSNGNLETTHLAHLIVPTTGGKLRETF